MARKKTGKILIFSDLHAHSHKKSIDRLGDCIAVLDWVFRAALDRQIADVVFLGDMFHDRQRIEVLTIHRVVEVFEKYFHGSSDLRLWLMLGNHDLWHRDKRDVYSPRLLAAFPGVTIVDQPRTLEIAGLPVDFLPFTENPIADLASLKDSPARVLCAHLAIDGAKLNSFGTQADVVVEHDGDMVRVDTGFLASWDRVFLGHYHAEQALSSRVEYVGSPLQLSFSEAFQRKHIVEFDTNSFDKEYLVNDFSPVHLVLKPEEVGDYDLTGNFACVRVDDLSAASVVEMRKEILEKYDVGTLEIRAARKATAGQENVKDAKVVLYEKDKMLERYVDEKPQPGLERSRLLNVGMDICSLNCSL